MKVPKSTMREPRDGHDKYILKKRFDEGDMILLSNSKLSLFLSKLRSWWLGSFQVTNIHPHSIVEVSSESTGSFKVNGQQLKPYLVGEPIQKVAIHTLTDLDPIQR